MTWRSRWSRWNHCSGSRGAYLGVGGEKIREVVDIKMMTKFIFGRKRCARKGIWGADCVLLVDLSGGYATTHFIMIHFAGVLWTFSVCMLFNGVKNPTYHSVLKIFPVRIQRMICRILLENLKFSSAMLAVISPIILPFLPKKQHFLGPLHFQKRAFFFFAKILSLNRIVRWVTRWRVKMGRVSPALMGQMIYQAHPLHSAPHSNSKSQALRDPEKELIPKSGRSFNTMIANTFTVQLIHSLLWMKKVKHEDVGQFLSRTLKSLALDRGHLTLQPVRVTTNHPTSPDLCLNWDQPIFGNL